MKALLPASLVLLGWPSLATAQLLVPIGQDRSATASASGGGVVDSDSAAATTFGPFAASVTADGDNSYGFTATSGASVDSDILSDAFVATGNQSSSTGFDSAADADSVSIAEIDFQIDVKCRYHVQGRIEGYDNGFAEWYLYRLDGTFVDGEIGIAKGPIPIDTTGMLEPGSYTVMFHAFGGSSGANDFSFSEYDLRMDLTPLAENYCVASPNSTGGGAVMGLSGSQSLAANDFHLEATGGVPNGSGLFFYGPSQVQVPFGDGFRCVGGMTFRLNPPVQSDGSGFATRQVDFTAPPAASGAGAILPDSIWNFQLWYRDPMGPGGTGFNVSDGLSVTFCR